MTASGGDRTPFRVAVEDRLLDAADRLKRLTPSGLAERLQERLAMAENHRMLAEARARAASEPSCFEPLVTIRIPTYNRGHLLAERALASAIRQTYERLEILVVGDACDDATAEAALSTGDPRVRFVNLRERGIYPAKPRDRWKVAGELPVNTAIALAQGTWIAPCDDDDSFTDDHVEVLLRTATSQDVEWIYSRARREVSPGVWRDVGGPPFRSGRIVHSTVLYRSYLSFLRYSPSCWRMGEPADWNLWRRMRAVGVRMGFADHVTCLHYAEERHR